VPKGLRHSASSCGLEEPKIDPDVSSISRTTAAGIRELRCIPQRWHLAITQNSVRGSLVLAVDSCITQFWKDDRSRPQLLFGSHSLLDRIELPSLGRFISVASTVMPSCSLSVVNFAHEFLNLSLASTGCPKERERENLEHIPFAQIRWPRADRPNVPSLHAAFAYALRQWRSREALRIVLLDRLAFSAGSTPPTNSVDARPRHPECSRRRARI